MAGFDNFKAFVHHRGGIDRYLSSHLPGGMPQSLLRRNRSKFFPTPAAERTAGSSNEDTVKRILLLTPEAQPYGTVFTVDRKKGNSFLTDQGHYHVTAGNECLLIGKRDILTFKDRFISRSKS